MEQPTTARRIVGAIRLLAGIFLGIVIFTQIIDLDLNGALAPEQYFTFFTVDTGFIEVVVLIAGGVWALTHARDTRLLTTIAMAVVPYAIVTGLVYNVMLRSLPPEKYLGMPWLNEALHVWLPIYLALDWFVLTWAVRGRARLGWSALLVAASFPIIWVVFTLVRGAINGYYPYPFLNPATAGVESVVIWVAGLTVFILALASICVLITRVNQRPENDEWPRV